MDNICLFKSIRCLEYLEAATSSLSFLSSSPITRASVTKMTTRVLQKKAVVHFVGYLLKLYLYRLGGLVEMYAIKGI